jgi:hypothetical protein
MNRNFRIIAFFIRSAVVLLLGWLYFSFNPLQHSFFPSCPFHALTHLYCPGCGSQRSLSALLHGHIVQALSFNPLFIASLPLVFYSAVVYTLNTFGVHPVRQKLVYSPLFINIILSTVIVFFVLRNLPFPFFAFLRPD